MLTTKSTTQAAFAVPRHVRNLNAIAERAGMSVTMGTTSVPDQPESNLMARWEGTLEQLGATGLVVPHMVRRIQWAAASSGHARGGRCRLSSSAGGLMGEACVSGDRIVWEIDLGPLDYGIEQRGDVEVVTYSHEVIYHGSAAALEGVGISRKHLPTGKRKAKGRYGVEGPEPAWSAHRQPDGLYVYRQESEELIRIRRERQAARQCQHQEEHQQIAGRRPAPPISAAEWKLAQRKPCTDWILHAINLLEYGSLEPPRRFRLEEGALQRIRAMAERFTRDFLAELDKARAIDTQAPRDALRLVVDNTLAPTA